MGRRHAHWAGDAAGRLGAWRGGLALLAAMSASGGGRAAEALCLEPAGDVTDDGATTVVDVQCETLLNLWVLGGLAGDAPGCLGASAPAWRVGDQNCDRAIDVADTMLVIGWVLGLGVSPVLDADGDGCVDACQLDSDGDGEPDISDCAPLDAAVAPEASEACNGWDDDCDGVVDGGDQAALDAWCDDLDACNGQESCPAPNSPQHLLFTEVLPNPGAAGPDAQWVELYNPTAQPVDIQGWILHGLAIDPLAIATPQLSIVPPGGFLVLAPSADPQANGGLVGAVAVPGLQLPPSGTVTLSDANDAAVTSVGYDSALLGYSIALAAGWLDPGGKAVWIESKRTYGPLGLHGTPGGPNLDVSVSACAPGAPMVCDDANPCTDNLCDPAVGCVFPPIAAACDDGDACTSGDACVDGACAGGAPLDCTDGNLCTGDSCTPALGCVHTAVSGPCSDGDACTTGDTCSGGTCVGGPLLDCDDSNPCTDDSCSSATGCVHTPNAAPCSDGDACTLGDSCSGGQCVGGQPALCDDANPCTQDSCSAATGCVHTAADGPCSDGNVCTMADACLGGSCTGGPPLNCNDGNPCTADSCEATSGCVHTPNGNPGCSGAPPGTCKTTITYGSTWIHAPNHPDNYDIVNGVVTWDGSCAVDGAGNAYATLSNGWTPYFEGKTCVIALDYSEGCTGVPSSCKTRITYGPAWLHAPNHPQNFDDVGGVVTWDRQCFASGGNSWALLSNGWTPYFKGADACDIALRYVQCGGLYANPVVDANCPDPGVLRVGSTYYMACTSGNWAYPIRASTDLVHWTLVGTIFTPALHPTWASGDYWAPEIHAVGGQYVAYFSARNAATGVLSIGAATSASPAGPFEDLGHPLIAPSSSPGVIDAHFFRASSGKQYLVWKVDGESVGLSPKIRIQELSADGLALLGLPQTILSNGMAWEGSVVEGPWMVERNGAFYLFYSGNFFASASYSIGVAKAYSPLGPFMKPSGPILESKGPWAGPGHGSVVVGPSGDWVFVYHAWKAGQVGQDPGRLVLVDRIQWDGTWPSMRSAPSWTSQPVP